MRSDVGFEKDHRVQMLGQTKTKGDGWENEIQSLESNYKANAVVQEMMVVSTQLAAVKASQFIEPTKLDGLNVGVREKKEVRTIYSMNIC